MLDLRGAARSRHARDQMTSQTSSELDGAEAESQLKDRCF